jgi:hypothetical protein
LIKKTAGYFQITTYGFSGLDPPMRISKESTPGGRGFDLPPKRGPKTSFQIPGVSEYWSAGVMGWNGMERKISKIRKTA